MATVSGLVAERLLEIEASSIVDGEVNEEGDLTLLTKGGDPVPVGNVRGEQGDPGPPGTISGAWPVGSVYLSIDPANPNPSTLFGGTWQQFAQGRVLVGVDPAQTEFDTVEKTGGSKTVTLTEAQIPQHKHSINHDHPAASTATDGAHLHGSVQFTSNEDGINNSTKRDGAGSGSAGYAENPASGAHSHTVNIPDFTGDSGITGGGGAHNNLQPYITCFMWKRTA